MVIIDNTIINRTFETFENNKNVLYSNLSSGNAGDIVSVCKIIEYIEKSLYNYVNLVQLALSNYSLAYIYFTSFNKYIYII